MNKKIIQENTANTIQLLEFEVAFPNEEKLQIEQYLSGGSRDVILNVSTNFLSFKNQNSKFVDNNLGCVLKDCRNTVIKQYYSPTF